MRTNITLDASAEPIAFAAATFCAAIFVLCFVVGFVAIIRANYRLGLFSKSYWLLSYREKILFGYQIGSEFWSLEKIKLERHLIGFSFFGGLVSLAFVGIIVLIFGQ